MLRACEQCGGPIPAGKRADARTCSDQCRWDLNRAKRAVRTDSTARLGTDNSLPESVAAPRGRAPEWEPPGEPSLPALTAEPCPRCGGPLFAGPRATWRACQVPATPAAVRAPHQAGTGAVRQVVTQRDKDLAAIGLARRKGIMLAQLAELAADSRLDPRSLPVVEWLAAEVRTAGSPSRLDELAELAADPAAGICRRRWWHGQPAALTAAGADDQDDDDQDDDDQGEDCEPALPAGGQPRPAGPGAGRQHRDAEMTAADALDALGWRLSPAAAGGCQIIEADRPCGAGTHHPIAGRHAGEAWVCGRHYAAVCKVITTAARSR